MRWIMKKDILVYILCFINIALASCLFVRKGKQNKCDYNTITTCTVSVNGKELLCSFFYGRYDGCELIK